jgi:hypothetical protein
MIKSISAEMEKIKMEGKQTYINPQNIDNRGNFKRPNNNAPRIMPREERDRDRSDQKIKNPLPNNLVIDEERGEEELNPKIHCIGDTSPFPHLTQSAYEESLMNSQINELIKGEKASSSTNKYNLRSKKIEGKSNSPNHPLIVEEHVKHATDIAKEKKIQNPSPIVKDLVPEVREILNLPSSFNFEHECCPLTKF